MNILLDMNLSPEWVSVLNDAGHRAVHWASVGAYDAPDSDLLVWANNNGYILFTHDLDFGAILAASGATFPSVIQLRSHNVAPDNATIVLDALESVKRSAYRGRACNHQRRSRTNQILTISLIPKNISVIGCVPRRWRRGRPACRGCSGAIAPSPTGCRDRFATGFR